MAAKAVDKVVLGPGVKLAAVDNTNKAVNSSGLKTKFIKLQKEFPSAPEHSHF